MDGILVFAVRMKVWLTNFEIAPSNAAISFTLVDKK